MSTMDVVTGYYRSLQKKDDKWKELWAEEAIFSSASKTLLARGQEAVIQSFTPFLKGVDSLKVSQRIVEGDMACFIVDYRYVNAKQETMDQDVAEVWRVRDGKLRELVIYFDLTAYRRFIQPQAAA